MSGGAPTGPAGTPQARKLGIRPGSSVALDQALGWQLEDPPEGISYVEVGPADVIVSFFRAAAELPERLAALGQRIFPAGTLWVAWPRRAGGHASDITDETIRSHALRLGLVDVKVAAIDDDWSGLKLVWRKEFRS